MPPTNTETLNTLYATTYQLRWKEVVDQVMLSTPFFYLMSKKGRKKSQSGGRYIEIPLQYATNQSITYVSKGQGVTLQTTDPLTTCIYNWKYLTGHIVRYFTDTQQNAGSAKIMDRVTTDISNLRDSLQQDLEEDLFEDGTGHDGKQINGLQNLVADAPTTGTVANLNRATYSWARNQYYNATGLTVSVVLLTRMRNMFNTCGKYAGGSRRFPDQVITTQALYEAYEAEITEAARVYTGDKALADLGFGDLSFKGRPITWASACPDYKMYFLNTSYLYWVIDPAWEFKMGEWLPIYTQPEDYVSHNLTACNLAASNWRRHGVIYNLGN